MTQLVLVVTRSCNQRCSYCPVVKEGWPSLTPEQAVRAVDLFVSEHGGGDVKLFGGEPLLEPAVVEAVLDEAAGREEVGSVGLYSNGLALDGAWISRLRDHPKATVVLSLDGVPEDHRRFRRPLDGTADGYRCLVDRLPDLLQLPRVAVTQVIPPETAHRAADNFRHLLSLGFETVKLLPASYVLWTRQQLAELRRNLDRIARTFRRCWAEGKTLHLHNLLHFEPQPVFVSGLVVDCDGRLFGSDCVVADLPPQLREELCLGTLDAPPSAEELRLSAARARQALQQWLPEEIWVSTLAADAELGSFCRSLRAAHPTPVTGA